MNKVLIAAIFLIYCNCIMIPYKSLSFYSIGSQSQEAIADVKLVMYLENIRRYNLDTGYTQLSVVFNTKNTATTGVILRQVIVNEGDRIIGLLDDENNLKLDFEGSGNGVNRSYSGHHNFGEKIKVPYTMKCGQMAAEVVYSIVKKDQDVDTIKYKGERYFCLREQKGQVPLLTH